MVSSPGTSTGASLYAAVAMRGAQHLPAARPTNGKPTHNSHETFMEIKAPRLGGALKSTCIHDERMKFEFPTSELNEKIMLYF